MCKGTSFGGGFLIKREAIHPCIRNQYTKDISVDDCIGEEVKFLLENGIATHGHSCCGHGKQQSQVHITEESVGLAFEMGYKVVKLDYDKFIAYSLLLNSGTQSIILQYPHGIHQ